MSQNQPPQKPKRQAPPAPYSRKLYELEVERDEREKQSQAFFRKFLVLIFVVPFVGMLLLVGCDVIYRAVR